MHYLIPVGKIAGSEKMKALARGGRLPWGSRSASRARFNPRLPAREATFTAGHERMCVCVFNPRPRAGGDLGHENQLRVTVVSIHAPRAGGDANDAGRQAQMGCFNPRPPRGGRRTRLGGKPVPSRFNPRPPRGGRLEGGRA